MTRQLPHAHARPLALLVAAALTLVACDPAPRAPAATNVQAVAGPDQAVTADPVAEVTLDGSGSVAPAGVSLTYAWELHARPEGSAAALEPADGVTSAFVADRPGTYVARLTVSGGEDSDSDTLTVQAVCPEPTVVDGDVTSDADWVVFVPTCPDYLVTSRGFVLADLVIGPGATVLFGPGAALENRSGSIQAVGTADAPITFRGLDPTPGFWKGIAFTQNDVRNELTHVVVDGAGAGRIATGLDDNAVGVDGSARVIVTNTTIRNSAGVGLRVGGGLGGSLQGFAANRFESNAGAPVELRLGDDVHYLDAASVFDPPGAPNGVGHVVVRFAGSVATERTWQALDVPVRFGPSSPSGLVRVEAPLSLAPGATFEFAAGFGIAVASGGSIVADASDAAITLRGVSSGAGTWVGVSIASDATQNVFDGVLLEGAGQGATGLAGQAAAIRVQSEGAMAVLNAEIRASGGCGIYAHPSAALTVTDSIFVNVAGDDICDGS